MAILRVHILKKGPSKARRLREGPRGRSERQICSGGRKKEEKRKKIQPSMLWEEDDYLAPQGKKRPKWVRILWRFWGKKGFDKVSRKSRKGKKKKGG